MTALRVCLVIDRLEVAGGPRLFEHLAAGLDPARFQVTVATAPDSPLKDVFEKRGARIAPVAFARPLDPAALAALTRLLRRERFDIVHGMGLRADFHARLAAKFAGSRVVSTVAMTAKGFEVSWLRRRLYQAAEGLSERWVDAFVTDCEFTRRLLIQEHGIPEAEVRTVYIGADPSLCDRSKADGARVRRELGLGSGPVVGSLGRLVAQKGHDVFLEAVAAAAREVPDLQAVVVGDGPLRPALESKAEALGIAGRTKFAGARRDLPDVLGALDVLVIASNLESLPVLLFEAMAMNCPIVATRVGGIPEVIEDGKQGILVEPGSPLQISSAVARLLRDRDWAAEMGKEARARVIAKFQVRDCVESMARLYLELAAGAR